VWGLSSPHTLQNFDHFTSKTVELKIINLWRSLLESLDMARAIVNILEDKKAEDIVLMDIQEVTTITDYFVICSGTSNRMLDALANAVREKMREEHSIKGRIEGLPQNGWVLADYGDVVVHIFSEDQREYYQLEELWSGGKTLLRLQ
jgi:ribosome-associated protein